ncbi:MAG: TRAPP complex subunit Trs23 [Amphiamblys sp. WSBS2006]|nr:MAG: TRAPP complex subunit Trs23 [Amphiamblys sp. WSBS2006]
MSVLSAWIVSRSGSLIYQQNIEKNFFALGENDYLVFAGMLQSINAILKQIGSTPLSSLKRIDSEALSIHVDETQTGTKFLLITTRRRSVGDKLGRFYRLYVDFVLKNVFYISDMPIRNSVFDKKVREL